MRIYFTLLVLSIALVACNKSDPAPGAITYPAHHQGKINLLALSSDTLFVSSATEFILAANVPANRSFRFVCKPADGTFWDGFGLIAFPTNPHLEWNNSVERMVYSSLDEEFEEDKMCAVAGTFAPFFDPNEPWINIHIIIYEDQTEWITRYITLVPR